MRVCPKCNNDVTDDKADFCPKCGTKIPSELRKIEVTYLPRIGGVLLLLGTVTFVLLTWYVPAGYGYYLAINGFLTAFAFICSLISAAGAWNRRGYSTTVGAAAVALLLEFMSFNSNEPLGYALPAGFLATLLGTMMVTAARQEFS